MNVKLREITPEDNHDLAAIIRHNLEQYDLALPGTVYFDPELDRLSDFYLADPLNRKYWILEDEDGSVLGGIGLAKVDYMDDTAEMQKIYLTDRVKGRGLGKLLVETIEKTAREMGFSKLYLETHTNLRVAVRLYEECGYRYIDRPEQVKHSTMNRFMVKDLSYVFPFGQKLHPLVQQDRTPKKVFVLGVYASAVHARWKKGNEIISQVIAVASEPRIFWDGNIDEAREIIGRCIVPPEVGYLEPAGAQLNGPSAKVLDEDILKPLGFTRADAWLCDMLPETRLNPNQVKVLKEKYEPLIEKYGLNEVTIPRRPNTFCDRRRCEEITAELLSSGAELLVLLGDLPIRQYLNQVADVPYTSLQEFADLCGYGNAGEAVIAGKRIRVIALAHPRQIGALGAHSEKWHDMHLAWEKDGNTRQKLIL